VLRKGVKDKGYIEECGAGCVEYECAFLLREV
jgi:hypothetical protein